MVEQKPTTINIDLRIKSGQQTLAEFASSSAAAIIHPSTNNTAVHPLPVAQHEPQQQQQQAGERLNATSGARTHSILIHAPVSTPAYDGAKFDCRGFCIWHPRCRLVRPLVGDAGGSDPNNYRVIRKICPSCGESSLVKKERKPTSHGFNPYNHAKSSTTAAAKKESLDNTNNSKERKESNDKLFTKVVPRSKSMAANSPHFRKKNESAKADHEKNHESNKLKSSERSKKDVHSPVREGKHPPKDDLRQRQKSQDHNTNKLQKQKSQGTSGGHHHDRKDELHKQKSQNAVRKEGKDDSLSKQKSSSDRKEDVVLKKSHSEKVKQQQNKSLRTDDKRDRDHNDRGPMHRDKKSNSQNNEEDKNRSKSEAHPDMKLKRKSSTRNHPQHTTAAPASSKCTEETPTIGASKSSTSKEDGGSSNKNAKDQPSKDNPKSSKLPQEKCQAANVKESQKNTEKKADIDQYVGKRVTIRRSARRIRSLSPPRQIIRKTSIPVTKNEEQGEENARSKTLKERSKSVGHPGLRQRLDSGVQYIHEKPVSHVPKATLSSYRAQFYTDVMGQSCLQSLMHKNLQI